jgi:hypothetical protein
MAGLLLLVCIDMPIASQSTFLSAPLSLRYLRNLAVAISV